MMVVCAPVYADGPEVGLNVGAAMPLSKYRRTVDGDIGGTFGLEGGYRFNLTEDLALSLIANPQFTFMPTDGGCCRGKNDEETGTSFSGWPALVVAHGDRRDLRRRRGRLLS